MTALYRTLLRPLLFAQESEAIHNRTLAALETISRSPLLCEAMAGFLAPAPLPVEVFGLTFPNPVGLAAGMDKHAAALPAWAAMGFGFTELGGVTWHAQPGNPAPRMFRAVPDRALINRMGFNNGGAEAMAARLRAWRDMGRWPAHPVGINLGKSKVTPLEEAAQDYANSFRVLRPFADFFVVNVSSPNTPNLRQLQDKAALDAILAALQAINAESSVISGQSSVAAVEARDGLMTDRTDHRLLPPEKPILVKVAPDLTFEALDEILELAGPRQLAGIVATNTTIARPATRDDALASVYAETGGLSGRPLAQRSTEVIRHLSRQTQGKLPIIGVGGIFNADDAREKLDAGASLVQLYTGLVYEGPGIVREIVEGLRARGI
jgi:dihydroorotate dehydrogenase